MFDLPIFLSKLSFNQSFSSFCWNKKRDKDIALVLHDVTISIKNECFFSYNSFTVSYYDETILH